MLVAEQGDAMAAWPALLRRRILPDEPLYGWLSLLTTGAGICRAGPAFPGTAIGFGERYQSYQRDVKGLIQFVW
jgi:hypothetical protein